MHIISLHLQTKCYSCSIIKAIQRAKVMRKYTRTKLTINQLQLLAFLQEGNLEEDMKGSPLRSPTCQCVCGGGGLRLRPLTPSHQAPSYPGPVPPNGVAEQMREKQRNKCLRKDLEGIIPPQDTLAKASFF